MHHYATALAALLALLGTVDCVPQQEADEMSPSLEITVSALLPARATRGGGFPEEARPQALELLAGALASRLAEAAPRGRSGCGNLTAAALAAAMEALLPPGAGEDAWELGAAPPGWRRLVSHRVVRLSADIPVTRMFLDDVDLSYQSILTLIVEMFASMVGLGWGAYSTITSG